MIQVAALASAVQVEEEPSPDERNRELPDGFMVFDIETGPLPDERLQQLCPSFQAPSLPGDFDAAAVKVGNLKDQAKINQKIQVAADAHQLAVNTYATTLAESEAQHFAKFRDRAPLDATTGRVVAIGVLDENDLTILGSEDDEWQMILEFWDIVIDCFDYGRPMVGFNIKHFDLPFLMRRSWILGIAIPNLRSGRYWAELFIDLMEVWQQGGRELVSLNTLLTAFGLPGKVEEVDGVAVDGASFHRVWNKNREVAKRYLEGDLLRPAELARRMGVV